MTHDEIIELQRKTIAEHIRAENEHDLEAIDATFIQDEPEQVYYDVIPMSTRVSGFKNVQDFYQMFDGIWPDFKLEVTGEYDVPGCSVREITVSGTHGAEYSGIAPTGKKVKFELAAFYLFGEGKNAGKLKAERIYYDNEMIVNQLTGGDDAPTGLGLPLK